MTDVTIDPSAIELEPEFQTEPVQVQETDVVFLPKKDFSARINTTTWEFSREVPKRIPRSLANMLLEDPDRGYIKE